MTDFHINTQLSLEEGIKEIIHGRLSYMVEGLGNRTNDHIAIHETRRTMKRIRAILRLIRDEIGYSNYYRENCFYRDLSGCMTFVRDSYVLLQSVEMIEQSKPEMLKAAEFTKLKEDLNVQISNDLILFKKSSGGFKRIVDDLGLARERIDQFCQLRNGFESIKKGIRRVYQRGRRNLSGLHDRYSADLFHEYRKSTKYLQYHMELIQPLYPKLLKAYVADIDKRALHMGEARDLDRLGFYIQNIAGGKITVAGKRSFLAYIEDQKKSLMDQVLSRSDLIYAEKTKEFINRINSYWMHQHK